MGTRTFAKVAPMLSGAVAVANGNRIENRVCHSSWTEDVCSSVQGQLEISVMHWIFQHFGQFVQDRPTSHCIESQQTELRFRVRSFFVAQGS